MEQHAAVLLFAIAILFQLSAASTCSSFLKPKFELRCSVQVTSSSEFEGLHNLYAMSLHETFNPLVTSNNTGLSRNRTLIENSQPIYGCTVHVTISKDFNLLLSQINVSAFAYDERSLFLGIIPTGKENSPENSPAKTSAIFQSLMFSSRNARVVLVVVPLLSYGNIGNSTDDFLCSWAVVCYLCSENRLQWNKGCSADLTGIENSKGNLDGNGKRVETRVGSFWSAMNHESAGFNSWKNCSPPGILNGIIYKKFNLSAPRDNNPMGVPRLSVCMYCPGLRIERYYDQLILGVNPYSYLYCNKRETLQPSSLGFFLHPFDLYIWSCIVTFMLVVGLLARTPWAACDIVWMLIGAPLQHKWGRRVICVIFLLLLPQQLYVAVFTSEVLSPLQPKIIQTNKELLQSGFKILDGVSNRSIKFTYKVREKVYFKKFGLSYSENYFVGVSELCSNLYPLDCIAKTADLGTIALPVKYSTYQLAELKSAYPTLHCASVKQVLDDTQLIVVQLDGHLRNAVKEYLSTLIAGGVHLFWDSLYFEGAFREVRVGKEPDFTYRSISFNTGLTAVLKLYVVLVLCSVLGFVCEIGKPILFRR